MCTECAEIESSSGSEVSSSKMSCFAKMFVMRITEISRFSKVLSRFCSATKLKCTTALALCELSNVRAEQVEMATNKVYAIVDYEDDYVQPLILAALKARLPPELLTFIGDLAELPSESSRVLQWRQYESIDFDHLLSNRKTSIANSFVIRKALIRKNYLASTVSHWLAKHRNSLLRKHVKPSVDIELDYAEFLDDALVEAWDLKESWDRNTAMAESESKEWWILKPAMSGRGQGIRLFDSEESLRDIFEGWDPPDSDEEDETISYGRPGQLNESNGNADGIMTSHLRHFIAQPYIHPPLLLPSPHPSVGRKFHIRTYVLCVGALKVYVYKGMLALFAEEFYKSPDEDAKNVNAGLNGHLTNTCLQSGEREGSVCAFWSLPSVPLRPDTIDWRQDVFQQICHITAETFEAAARSMSIHFQPLPNAFELFGVDFLVDDQGTAWLLEINAFPDFKQTGDKLKGLVQGLFEGVVDKAVSSFCLQDHHSSGARNNEEETMIEVLNIDLGKGNVYDLTINTR